MHRVNQLAQQTGIGGSQHAMSKVKDVPRAISGTTQDILHTLLNRRPGGKQHRRIKISLNAPIIADTSPCLIQLNTPIDANHITTSRSHRFQQCRRTCTKVNRRCTSCLDSIENTLGIGLYKLLVGTGTECANPTIEELNNISPGSGLCNKIT